MATVEEYADQLRRLFPPGRLWNFSEGSTWRKFLLGCAEELVRLHARADALIEETDPRTATETITAWENMLGVTASGALAQRRAAVTQAYVARGGGTETYFLQVLAALGISATISYYKVARSGSLRCGQRLYGPQWAYAWKVTMPAGNPSQAAIEAALRAAAPAHTTIIFSYV